MGTGKTNASDPLLKCRNVVVDIGTRAYRRSWEGVWRRSVSWPGGVRHEGGVSPVCGVCTERGKAGADVKGAHQAGETVRC